MADERQEQSDTCHDEDERHGHRRLRDEGLSFWKPPRRSHDGEGIDEGGREERSVVWVIRLVRTRANTLGG